MSASTKIPVDMSVAEFLAWCPEDGQVWELVDGTPRAMAPAKMGHNALLGELTAQLRNHLLDRSSTCVVVPTPGVVPRVRAEYNLRVPDLAVTCSAFDAADAAMPEPVLIIEALSPSNQAETWANVWAYTTIPSLREILVLRTTRMQADILRRGTDGAWPSAPEVVTAGDVVLTSVGFRAPLAALYRTTGLAR
jgi:Uma2 family endonuclease